MKHKILGLLAVGLLAGPVSVQATMITVYFRTTIDAVADPDGVFLANGIAVGSVFNGFYIYDDTATNTDCCGSNLDEWNLVDFSINLPGAVTQPIVLATSIGATDSYISGAAYDYSPSLAGGVSLRIVGDFGYGGELGRGLGHLIKPPPVLDSPVAAGALFAYGGPDGPRARGTATLSLTPFTSVPEPATLALLGLGLLGFGVTRRKAN